MTPEVSADQMSENIIKVSARSSAAAVAGAIAGQIRENGKASVSVIGPSALNQAVKAVIIARGYLVLEGKEIVMIPSFQPTEINGDQRTAIGIEVEIR